MVLVLEIFASKYAALQEFAEISPLNGSLVCVELDLLGDLGEVV